jgi:hypothetical protein
MTVTINGSTGVSLVQDSTITSAKIVNGAIESGDLNGTQTGLAPIYGARAWATFNASSGAIMASGNIASVIRNSSGSYTVFFETAMQSANYAVSCSGNGGAFAVTISNKTPTQFILSSYITASMVLSDASYVDFSVFQ